MTGLAKGARVQIGDGDLSALIAQASWDPGAIRADVVAFVCGVDGAVLARENFIFFHNKVSPERAVFLLEDTVAGVNRGAQLMLDLTALPSAAERIDVVLVAPSEDGRRLPTLESVSDIQFDLWDPTDGSELCSFAIGQGGLYSCLALGRLYRHQENWKFWAMGEMYPKDFASLVRDYGIAVSS